MALLFTWAALGLILLLLGRWALHRGFRAPRLIGNGSPADFGSTFETVTLATTNGKRLFGWYLPAAGDEAKAPGVAVLHGWGANAEAMLPIGVGLQRGGFAVLLIDARSHGRSDVDTFSSLPRFAEDLERAVHWLSQRPEVDAVRLAVLGHSLGGAAALLTAARCPELAAVVSLSAFAHPKPVMRAYMAQAFIPYWPLGWLISAYVQRIIGYRFDDIAPVTTIGLIRCPVLIGHGAEDERVPPDHAVAIHAHRRHDGVELAIWDGVGHDRVGCLDDLVVRLQTFLNQALAPAGRSRHHADLVPTIE